MKANVGHWVSYVFVMILMMMLSIYLLDSYEGPMLFLVMMSYLYRLVLIGAAPIEDKTAPAVSWQAYLVIFVVGGLAYSAGAVAQFPVLVLGLVALTVLALVVAPFKLGRR